MSLFGKIGHLLAAPVKGVEHLVKDPGKWAENAGRSVGAAAKTIAPVLPPGLRELAAFGGDIAAGGNTASHFKSLGMAELGAALAGHVPGVDSAGSKINAAVSHIPGASGLGSKISSVASHIPGASQVAGLLGDDTPGLIDKYSKLPPIYDETGQLIPNPGNPAPSGGLSGIIGKLGGGGKGNLTSILQALSGAEGAYNTVQSNKYRGKALDLANNQNVAAEPIRQAALEKLLHSQTPDLTSIYSNPQNPFSGNYRPMGG